MIFNEKNREELEKMFQKANGKSRERILTYENVRDALKHMEKMLGIPKKDMIGIMANIDPNAQDFPRAYKYTPYSIWFWAKKKASGWDVQPLGRYRTAPSNRGFEVSLTKEAKEAIIKTKEVF